MHSEPGTILQTLVSGRNSEQLRQLFKQASERVGESTIRHHLSEELIGRIGLEKVIPRAYERYRLLAIDGIKHFLSKVDINRLLGLVLELNTFDKDSPAEAYLIETAKHFPTLHKLGQLIARNKNIDPEVKKWLVLLESGHMGSSSTEIRELVKEQLSKNKSCSASKQIHIAEELLAEASVAAVICYSDRSETAAIAEGVCKVLKPAVAANLAEELEAIGHTAKYLTARRQYYNLLQLDIGGLFAEIRETMQKETDLASEQHHLREARQLYRSNSRIKIPELFDRSGSDITCMEYLEGVKITDAGVSLSHARSIARTLFDALVCTPLFSVDDEVLFHGDPHAGNIILKVAPGGQSYTIGLVDWSLAGRLSKVERVKINKLVLAVIKEDCETLAELARSLAVNDSVQDIPDPHQLAGSIRELLQKNKEKRKSIVSTVFWLLEELACQGLVFKGDLLLFRKAVFTLEGVLHDISPDFDLDNQLMCRLAQIMSNELPLRLNSMLFPIADRPESYPSLISNLDLQSLFFHQYSTAVMSNLATATAMAHYWQGTAWPLPK